MYLGMSIAEGTRWIDMTEFQHVSGHIYSWRDRLDCFLYKESNMLLDAACAQTTVPRDTCMENDLLCRRCLSIMNISSDTHPHPEIVSVWNEMRGQWLND